MIKFFRIIRQKLVQENRVGKYLLYAVGEILLVIIGIMIALNLNKVNEAKTQEKKIQVILSQVQDELNTAIERSNYFIENLRQKDSLINLVMNNKVSEADYKYPENNALRYLNSSSELIIQNDGFNSLMLKSEVLPDKYGPLVNGLKQLYSYYPNRLEYFNQQLTNEFWKEDDYIRNNYDWFGDYFYSDGATDEILDYFLNDVKYRHSLANTALLIRAVMSPINSLRIDAIKYIREIDALLETDNTYEFDINISDYADWIGKYHFEGDTIQIDHGEAGLKRNRNNGEWHTIYPLSKTKFHFRGAWFYLFEKNEQGEIIGYTASQLNTRDFWEKIK